MRLSRTILIKTVCLFVVATTVLVGFRNFTSASWGTWKQQLLQISGQSNTNGTSPVVTNASASSADGVKLDTQDAVVADEPPPVKVVNPELYRVAIPYVGAIMNPGANSTLPRLECPSANMSRYEYLRTADHQDVQKLKYFFALDLRECIGILPRLIGSIIEAARFLGVNSCALSIVEGNSEDGTYEVLDLLRPELAKIGLEYVLQSTTINPKEGERITQLAALRNLALSPLTRTAAKADADTSIVFLNDVVPCVPDILELVHQRVFQAADMTCATDWAIVGPDPTFYDVWVARTLRGDLFFNIPEGGSWDEAWNLFWNDDDTRRRFQQKVPFQVFACWNGVVVFGAGPVLGLGGEEKVAFRESRKGECFMGEPTLFCKDMWWAGHGRIAVVPSVNLEYVTDKAVRIKNEKGYTSEWTAQEDSELAKISWVDEPPAKIRCMPNFQEQSWVSWNETLS